MAMHRILADRRRLSPASSDESGGTRGRVELAITALPVSITVCTRSLKGVDMSRVAGLLSSLPTTNESKLRWVYKGC